MSTRLVILGLLRDRPLYGYEIKHIIEEHMGDWTSIAFGSIYFALNKLAEEDFIEKTGTTQEGGPALAQHLSDHREGPARVRPPAARGMVRSGATVLRVGYRHILHECPAP